MAQQVIDIGATANDGTGDPIRDAFDKCNDNFGELYAGLTGLLDYKGATDCSANPNYPAASKGDYYLVSVAGKIGGASGVEVQAGDSFYATADNAGGTQAAVGASWTAIQGNLVVDNDTALAADSASKVPSQHAVKAYVDAAVASGTVAELDDVGDVNAPAPSNGDVLTWDSTPGEWVPQAPSGGSYTSENARDDIAAALVPGSGITITPNDGADTITIAAADLGVLHSYDEKASGTAGGGTTAATWHPRVLNVIKLSSITGAANVSSAVTMTIASPCVVTWNSHGLTNGSAITFTTTGALPTGLAVGTVYYVVSAAANSFSVAATIGGAAINTSGSQSGAHTAWTSEITLPAGTYDFLASAPTFAAVAFGSKIRLYNVTDAAELVPGTTEWVNGNVAQRCIAQGRFVLAAPKNVAIHSYSSVTRATDGLGVNAGLTSINNHFTDIMIRRVL